MRRDAGGTEPPDTRDDASALVGEFLARHSFSMEPCDERKLAIYLKALVDWNRKLNLVSFDSPRRILDELIVDSFYLAAFLETLSLPPGAVIWDPGAGAGLPGIPLRIIWSRGKYTMIEQRQKRSLFLANMLAGLKLPGTSVYRGSAADFFAGRAKADCVLSRAFRPWREMLALCANALAPHGTLVIMASEAPPGAPHGWQLAASSAYTANDKRRWLWAFSLASQPNAQ